MYSNPNLGWSQNKKEKMKNGWEWVKGGGKEKNNNKELYTTNETIRRENWYLLLLSLRVLSRFLILVSSLFYFVASVAIVVISFLPRAFPSIVARIVWVLASFEWSTYGACCVCMWSMLLFWYARIEIVSWQWIRFSCTTQFLHVFVIRCQLSLGIQHFFLCPLH